MKHGSVVWFRNDLRLADNPALHAAVERGGPVTCVFIWAPEEEGRWAPGAASRWWLHHSLNSLDAELKRARAGLVIRRGPTLAALRMLIAQTNASAVYFNRRYEPAAVERDARVAGSLTADGVRVESFNASLLLEPWELKTKQGAPYQVFTPFWRAARERFSSAQPMSAPRSIPKLRQRIRSLPIEELELLPRVNWDRSFYVAWTPGTSGAQDRLERFLAFELKHYPRERDRPDHWNGTSNLSPHLHFGEISPRQIWRAAHASRSKRIIAARDKFLTEIGWREFAYHVLYHFPQTAQAPLRTKFDSFPWQRQARDLNAWQRGLTGYPIVDAGMAQLWITGWMHNRVRMIVGSFLTKDLLHSWREGAAWFWDTLVDADLANNTLNWQWVAGCGADAAPFFRIFNPVAQAKKFDPDGNYIRAHVPPLGALPNRWIHEPWNAPADVLREAGVVLGDTYPHRIVDHAEARTRTLAVFRCLNGR
jgi:deoxyribodipyrimidine photo-lyase